jgi:RecA/RadA recombinase
MLNGGIPKGVLVDVYGSSGSGKTQFVFQISAISALEGYDVFFIDTLNTFRPERVAEIVRLRNLDEERVLKRIKVKLATNLATQLAAPSQIKACINDARVILIIDNLTENFLREFENEQGLMLRQSILARHLHELSNLSLRNNISIIFTNNVRWSEENEREVAKSIVSQYTHIKIKLVRNNYLHVMLEEPIMRRVKVVLDKAGIHD